MRTIATVDALGPLSERELQHAPPVLHLMGDVEILRTTARVAIVGSRDASQDGLRRARRLARFLTAHGITVVSGLAFGIDAAAHEAAMDSGGRTVAVMPTPLDAISPRAHQALFDRIASEHLAVSEFASGSPVSRGNFPRRNRTMALMTHASVIIEAGEGSGTLSQGWEAIRLGRPLFLAASVLAAKGLSWPRQMQDYGASVLADPEQLLEVVPAGVPLAAADLAF